MVLPNDNKKINFILPIFYSFSEMLTGGIVVLHKLANLIASKGHNVFIFCEPNYPNENIKVIPCYSIIDEEGNEKFIWDFFSFDINNTVSVYPQITKGNPFNTKHVSRWILYDTQKDIENTYDKNDIYFNYENFITFNKKEYKQLTVNDYHFDELYRTNFGQRKTFCHINHKHTPPNGEDVFKYLESEDISNWKQNGSYSYLRKKLNEYEYFLTYDQKTFYTLCAGLCGTKSIILNPKKRYEKSQTAFSLSEEYNNILTPTEFRLKNRQQMFGIAYGWEDLEWANKTIDMVPNYLKEIEKIDLKTFDNFIKYWEEKIL